MLSRGLVMQQLTGDLPNDQGTQHGIHKEQADRYQLGEDMATVCNVRDQIEDLRNESWLVVCHDGGVGGATAFALRVKPR